MAKRENTASIAERLAQPVLEKMGLSLWDVGYEKEGSCWYLRYYIERVSGGLTIQDCEDFSRAVEQVLDEADPIEDSYVLEVSSPGVERRLTRDSHYAALAGAQITARLVRPDDTGCREYTGVLVSCDNGEITLRLPDGGEKRLNRADTAWVKQYFEL